MPIDDKNPDGTPKQDGWKKHKIKKFELEEPAPEVVRDSEGYLNLGTTRGWTLENGPKEFVACQSSEPKHLLIPKPLSYGGRGIIEKPCPICKIRWTDDTTD